MNIILYKAQFVLILRNYVTGKIASKMLNFSRTFLTLEYKIIIHISILTTKLISAYRTFM